MTTMTFDPKPIDNMVHAVEQLADAVRMVYPEADGEDLCMALLGAINKVLHEEARDGVGA